MKKQYKQLVSLLLIMGIATACTAEEFKAEQFKSANQVLNYRIHIPVELKPGKKYPLVMFFHGAGERGSDNKRQLIHGVSDMLSYLKKNNKEAIIIAPQCPKKEQWVNTPWWDDSHTMPKTPSNALSLSIKLMNKTVKEMPVASSRIYACGLSMGGFGTWDIIQRMPNTFAAALPVCGGGDTEMAEAIKDIPIWAFHGGNDGVVKTKRSRDMIAAIKKVGGSPKYTEYKGVGHNSWTATFKNPDVLKWLFTQKKNKVDNTMKSKVIINNLWPGGHFKALTLSYDDGCLQDIRLIELLNKYKIKSTFHLNSGFMTHKDYVPSSMIKELYKNHEVSVHTVSHQPFIKTMADSMIMHEVFNDKAALESLVSYPVRGMSYPCGSYSPKMFNLLRQCGMTYARTVNDTSKFDIPENFLEWHPTCSHNNELMARTEEFLQACSEPGSNPHAPLLFYVWGHSFEFDHKTNDYDWEFFEDFLKIVSNQDDVWYGTNIEVADYCSAVKNLQFSANNKSVFNPSGVEVWFSYDWNKKIFVRPGETLVLD